ncbi:MAG: hypothetical protein HUK15_03230 [Bacteroidales bacterium]|nr:hypothetical protein [Bacteroidales bacterium]
MKVRDVILAVLRIAIGAFFVATAILKILSLDNFVLYVYSYGLFNYTLCSIIARLVISFELCAGLCLMLRWWHNFAWWVLQLSLVAFTVFLIFAQLRGDENCHCLGDLVELNPLESMMKNVVLMILMMAIRGTKDWSFKADKIVKPLVVLVVACVPFIVNPPEVIYSRLYSDKVVLDEPLLMESFSDTTLINCYPVVYPDAVFDSTTFVLQEKPFSAEGRNVLVVASSQCKHCKYGIKKLALIFKENAISRNNCKVLIWCPNAKSVFDFIIETESYGFEYREISPITAINMVGGAFPTFIFTENGSIVEAFDSGSIDEKKIVEFLKN